MSNGVGAGHVSGAGKVFRVQGIPLGWDVDRLRSVLESEGDFLSPSVRSLAIEIHGRWNTATVSFIGVPQPIKSRIALPTAAEQADGSCLTLDDHFHGITTLYVPEDYQINLISLSGLGGHAFGSFKERGGEHMWLRDSLPHHLVGQNGEPFARIMIYGYESSIPKSQSFQNITDLATTFRSSLLALASEKSILPVVLVAHSLGGLLAKELLVLLSQSENADEFGIFQAVFGLVFFGVPHGGMDIQSLVPMAGDGPNRPLIDSLGIANPKTREKQEEAFFKALGKREIISFYETLMSPTAQQDENGRWKMNGPPTVLVTKESATHRRRWAPGPEQLCAINRNHSEMVKFRPHDSDYENALQLIKGIAQRATSVSQQLSRAGNIALDGLSQACIYNQMNDNFFGRDDVLENISKRFLGSSENGDTMAETARISDKVFEWIVLYGLKGIGKTRIVHEYVSRWRDRYDDIFLIPASDPTVFAGGMDRIYTCGNIGVFSQWLKSQTMRRRWLLIVDDVVEDTVEQALSLPSPSLRTGEAGIGHVLFTTYSDKLARLSLSRGHVIEVHYLEEDDSKRLFLSVSRSQHDEWGDYLLSMLPRYPISVNLIATAVLNDNLNKIELEAILRDNHEQAEYMKNDRKFGVIFKMLQRKFEEDGQKSLFLAVLSHLHTTSLDLRLLVGCLADRPFQSEQPQKRSKFLKLFKPNQPTVDHRPGASTVEQNRVQLREISPPLTTAGLGSMGSLASQYASLSLIRRHEWSIHIPDVFRDHIRTLAGRADKELSHKHFTLSLVLAIEITLVRESLFSDDRKLAENFASLVNSLTRHARNHDLQPWEHFYLAELNFQVAAYLCRRSWTSIGVQTYEKAMKHWKMSRIKDNAHFFGHVENYGLALVDERKYDDAETYLRAAYDGLRKFERKNSPPVIRARHNVVNIKQEKGHLVEASEGFKKMLTDYKGKIELEDWVGLRLSYAMAMKDQGRYSDAWKELESALRDLFRESKANSDSNADISAATARIFVYDVALVLMNLSRHHEADNLFRCVISSTDNMLQKAVITNDTISNLISTVLTYDANDTNSQSGDEQSVFDAEFCLGLSLIEQEQYEAAASHFSRVKRDMDRLTSLGESVLLLNCTNRTLLLEGIALSAFFCGAYEEAEAGFLSICNELKELENKSWCPLRMVRVKEGLAMASGMQSKIGREELEAAMEFSKKHFGDQHPELYTMFHRFAMVMEKQGDKGTAAQWYSVAYHGRLKTLSEHHILTKQSELGWRSCLRSEK